MTMSAAAFRNMMGNNPQSQTDGAWSQAGKLICRRRSPIVPFQACFPRPSIYTLQFELSSIPVLYNAEPGNVGPSVQANIEWIANGTPIHRSISIINGTSISGLAESVKGIIFDTSVQANATVPPSEVGIDGMPYTATVNIIPGLRAAQSQQPFFAILNPDDTSIYWGKNVYQVNTASTLTLFFPQDVFPPIAPINGGITKVIGATSIHVSVGSTGGTPIANQEAQVGYSNGLLYDPRDSPQWQPLPPGTTSVTLFNNSAGGSAATYFFSVKLGIDG
jgi:hypothetical protein